VHLWIVAGLSLLWNAVGAFDYVMTQTANEAYMSNFSAEQLEYFYGFPLFATAAWAVAVWSSVLGSVLLFLRRGLADPVFLISFVAMAGNTIYTTSTGGWSIMGGAGAVAFSGAIFLVSLALWLYARALRRQGVLK
jgi:hypothetical protein